MRVVPTLGHLAGPHDHQRRRRPGRARLDRGRVQPVDGQEQPRRYSCGYMEQAVRDGIIDRNPARVTGWQHEYQRAEDELDDPRALALPDWTALTRLADALVARSADHFRGWGDVVIFAACTAARIGEVSGVPGRGHRPRRRGRGRSAGRPRPSPAAWSTRAPRASAPGRADHRRGSRPGANAASRHANAAGRPAVHRAARRPDHHGRSPRRDPLGRGGHRTGLRAPAPARPASHRPDLDGRRCRCTSCARSPGTARSPPRSGTCTRTGSRSTRPA